MTNSVTFDTSGSVMMPLGIDQGPVSRAFWRWPDLSPFCQGFVEAAFASLLADAAELFDAPPSRDGWAEATSRPLGFSDLHPATLARFMEECEVVQRIFAGIDLTAEDGRRLWGHRADGFPGPLETDRLLRNALRPLRLHLPPDGKVMAEEVSKEIAK
jgi:hypothetical protein